jgi:hypothetical protein
MTTDIRRIIDLIEASVIHKNGLVMDDAFKVWFADSKIVDEQGNPRVVYHQTKPENVDSIDAHGFELNRAVAAAADFEMPIGVFFKPSNEQIRLGQQATAQLPFVLSIKNPLVVDTRKELVAYLCQDTRYKRLHAALTEFEQTIITRQGNWWDAEQEHMQKLADYYDHICHKVAPLARKIATAFIRDHGHDGLNVVSDEGAMGRTTETLVIFDPSQARRVRYEWS